MQLKSIRGDRKEHVKNRSNKPMQVKSGYDILNLIPSFEKMNCTVVATKNFVKN